MLHETFPVGPLQCNCSIVGDPATGEALVIDPGADLTTIRQRLAAHDLRCTQIIVTHAHIDHIAGARRLSQITGAPVFYNQLDIPLLQTLAEQGAMLGMAAPDAAPPDASADEGTKIAVGSHTATVIHTPGHTEGSICLHFSDQNLLIAGDTLFQNGIGRTDLWGGDPKKMIATLRDKISQLPAATKVVPGHGPSTSIEAELENNIYLAGL